jgi:hypothetical protein
MYESDAVPRLEAIVELVKEIPTELLNIPAPMYAELFLAVESIKSTIAHWPQGAYRQTFTIFDLDPVTLIRHILAQCPDEFPSATTAALIFISDPALRDSIRLDISSSNQALNNGEWKAATVLAGAAIEALLLWAVQEPTVQQLRATAVTAAIQLGTLQTGVPNNPVNWNLHQFIEVTHQMQMISDDTRTAALLVDRL